MKILKPRTNEKARLVCFATELDEALEAVQFLFASRCRVKVVVRNFIAVIVVF